MERRLKADNIDFSDDKLMQAGITAKETFENYNLEKCVERILNYIETNTKRYETLQGNGSKQIRKIEER